MRISSINSISNKNFYSFKHTAVPYPEFEKNTNNNNITENEENTLLKLKNKISEFFSPDVEKEAEKIKHNINTVVKNTQTKPAQAKAFSAVA